MKKVSLEVVTNDGHNAYIVAERLQTIAQSLLLEQPWVSLTVHDIDCTCEETAEHEDEGVPD
jgi:hypothetical protein